MEWWWNGDYQRKTEELGETPVWLQHYAGVNGIPRWEAGRTVALYDHWFCNLSEDDSHCFGWLNWKTSLIRTLTRSNVVKWLVKGWTDNFRYTTGEEILLCRRQSRPTVGPTEPAIREVLGAHRSIRGENLGFRAQGAADNLWIYVKGSGRRMEKIR